MSEKRRESKREKKEQEPRVEEAPAADEQREETPTERAPDADLEALRERLQKKFH